MFASPLPISYSLAAWKTGAQMRGTIFDNVTPLVEVILALAEERFGAALGRR